MIHPELYPHQATFSQLATENNLEPADIACAERAFGNDFDAMQAALDDVEPLTLEDL